MLKANAALIRTLRSVGYIDNILIITLPIQISESSIERTVLESIFTIQRYGL
jgi:hypothetical protein